VRSVCFAHRSKRRQFAVLKRERCTVGKCVFCKSVRSVCIAHRSKRRQFAVLKRERCRVGKYVFFVAQKCKIGLLCSLV